MLIFATTFVYTAVLSGDTIILRSEQAPPKGQAAKERFVLLHLCVCYNLLTLLVFRNPYRVVHLAGVSAPRLGSMSREDEVRARRYSCIPSVKLMYSITLVAICVCIPRVPPTSTCRQAGPVPNRPHRRSLQNCNKRCTRRPRIRYYQNGAFTTRRTTPGCSHGSSRQRMGKSERGWW
jgi:hypothetical protein